jgi:hypothetical protein
MRRSSLNFWNVFFGLKADWRYSIWEPPMPAVVSKEPANDSTVFEGFGRFSFLVKNAARKLLQPASGPD